MFVRVSLRRSVTILPLVATVDSVNNRDTLPLSFVVTDDSAVLEVISLDFGLSDAARTQSTATVNTPPIATIIDFLHFMSHFLSVMFL
jgi:hypothetical protein